MHITHRKRGLYLAFKQTLVVITVMALSSCGELQPVDPVRSGSSLNAVSAHGQASSWGMIPSVTASEASEIEGEADPIAQTDVISGSQDTLLAYAAAASLTIPFRVASSLVVIAQRLSWVAGGATAAYVLKDFKLPPVPNFPNSTTPPSVLVGGLGTRPAVTHSTADLDGYQSLETLVAAISSDTPILDGQSDQEVSADTEAQTEDSLKNMLNELDNLEDVVETEARSQTSDLQEVLTKIDKDINDLHSLREQGKISAKQFRADKQVLEKLRSNMVEKRNVLAKALKDQLMNIHNIRKAIQVSLKQHITRQSAKRLEYLYGL